jgi:L-fuculose-phosphate aldolase
VPATERSGQLGELIRASQILDRAGMCPATDGNFSARCSADAVFLTRSGIEKRGLEESSFVQLNLGDANPSGGSSEWELHRALYRARPKIACILHVHAPFLTTFAAAGKVPPAGLLAEAHMAIGEIVLAPFCMPGTRQLGEACVSASSIAMVYLLANHGAVSLGTSVRDALHRLERAEFLARVAWQCVALGGGLPLSPTLLAQMPSLSAGETSTC